MSDIPQIIRGKPFTVSDHPDNVRELTLVNGAILRFIDPSTLVGEIAAPPGILAEMHRLPIKAVIELMSRAGKHLKSDTFSDAIAFDAKYGVLSEPLLHEDMNKVQYLLKGIVLKIMLRNEIDPRLLGSGRPLLGVRPALEKAVGQRCLHFMPGHTPIVQILDTVKALLSKGDHVFVTSPDDPLSLPTFAQLLIEADPIHVLNRHISCIFWPPEQSIKPLLDSGGFDRVVFWGEPVGGRDALLHSREVQDSGIKTVMFGSRASISLVGREAFKDDSTLREAARLLAIDMSAYNQFSCGASRTAYVQATTQQAQHLAELVYEELQNLPESRTTPFETLPHVVRQELKTLKMNGAWGVGSLDGKGMIFVGDMDIFTSHRTLVIKPIENFEEEVIPTLPNYTQTVGLFPFHRLHDQLWSQLTSQGACRLIDLGHAVDYTPGGPFNGFNQTEALTQKVLIEHSAGNKALFYLQILWNLIKG